MTAVTGGYAVIGERLFVPGTPVPQGSKSYKGRRRNGTAILVESAAGLHDWRARIALTEHEHGWRPVDGPFAVDCGFVLRRPVRTPRSYTPPATKKPDGDKLQPAKGLPVNAEFVSRPVMPWERAE